MDRQGMVLMEHSVRVRMKGITYQGHSGMFPIFSLCRHGVLYRGGSWTDVCSLNPLQMLTVTLTSSLQFQMHLSANFTG